MSCWQTAEVKQWNKTSRVSWTSWSVSHSPPWKRRPKNGRQKPLCLFFLWMLHVWLSEEKTRKLPSKHKWDYSLGSWRSVALFCRPKTAREQLLVQKTNHQKEILFWLLITRGETDVSVLSAAEAVSPAGTFKTSTVSSEGWMMSAAAHTPHLKTVWSLQGC